MPTLAAIADADARAESPSRRHGKLALLLMIASGFAGLSYQIVWTQQTALWLGHESAAVLAVVAAFFAGLAAGALLLSPPIERSARPARWYAACEATVGLWSLALTLLLEPATRWFLDVIGPQPTPAWHWSVAFGGTLLLLLPATVAMGAALPAMERVTTALRRQGTSISALYAANTFGAVGGVLATAFVLIPRFGLRRTTILCAALNLLCAAVATQLPTATEAADSVPSRSDSRQLTWLLAATGMLGIGYEVLVVRVVSQVAENTVYTFAILLAVYLIGTTLGAATYSRLASFVNDSERLLDRLLQLLVACCLCSLLWLANAASVKAAVLELFGPSMLSGLSAEAALAVGSFVLPTFVMGALFSHLAIMARSAGTGFGKAIGINTLGAAAASVVFGVLLLPALGSKGALLTIVVGYLALSSRRMWRAPSQWLAATVTAGFVLWLPTLAIVDVPDGGRVISHTEGMLAAVSVVEDAQGVARLHINNRQQEGSSATVLADARQALLPILLHPAPRRALFLGLGTGVTAASAAADPALHVDAVELLPEVIAASAGFTRRLKDSGASRLQVMPADARRYVRTTRTQYDVIVSDNFHPARSGSGALYTVEHFTAVRDQLTDGGVFCQWLPLHQLDTATLRSIVRTFISVYPQAYGLLATNSLDTPVLGLVSRQHGEQFDVAQLHERFNAAAALQPAAYGFHDELDILGSFIAGPQALADFSRYATLNSDDLPIVTYIAPRITYSPESLPRDRLLGLLRELAISPQALLSESSPKQFEQRLCAYWTARNRFIAAGRDVQPTMDVQRMLAQVQQPLLAVLRISPEFRPAYDPLLNMATALAAIDADAARALLSDLQHVQPLRPEAGEQLRQLSGSAVEKW